MSVEDRHLLLQKHIESGRGKRSRRGRIIFPLRELPHRSLVEPHGPR